MANIHDNEDIADIADNINSIALNLVDICKAVNKSHAKFIYDGRSLVNINQIISIEETETQYGMSTCIYTSSNERPKVRFRGNIIAVIKGIEELVDSDKTVKRIY